MGTTPNGTQSESISRSLSRSSLSVRSPTFSTKPRLDSVSSTMLPPSLPVPHQLTAAPTSQLVRPLLPKSTVISTSSERECLRVTSHPEEDGSLVRTGLSSNSTCPRRPTLVRVRVSLLAKTPWTVDLAARRAPVPEPLLPVVLSSSVLSVLLVTSSTPRRPASPLRPPLVMFQPTHQPLTCSQLRYDQIDDPILN